MPTIALIDDRKDARTTLQRMIGLKLQGAWKIVAIYPLVNLQDYLGWIMENEVAVLLIDEKLHEQQEIVPKHVSYDGHDLVDFIRQRIPTLPIFVITAFQNDEELQQRFQSVEDIIPRQDFARKANEYIVRIKRASQKFTETFENELSALSVAASKIAIGKASSADRKRASAIQAKIGVTFATETFAENDTLLKGLETKIAELRQVRGKLKKFIKTK